MKEENSLIYLGHMLSKNGDNMPNISHMRNKSIGTQRKIINLIEPMCPYRFEGTIIYIQSLKRNSILYASETMSNVKEKELKAQEKIEEPVLQKIFKTKLSCPWNLLYLEAGIMPARYRIHRQMLVFLQYILQQPKKTHRCTKCMKQKTRVLPRGAGLVKHQNQLLHITQTFIEVQNMKTSLFKRLVTKT